MTITFEQMVRLDLRGIAERFYELEKRIDELELKNNEEKTMREEAEAEMPVEGGGV